jgi:hypothetical protein
VNPVSLCDQPRCQPDTTEQSSEPSVETPTPLPPAGAGACAAEIPESESNQSRTPTKTQREAAAVEAVLADWRAATGRKRQYRNDSRGWRKTRDRLRAGYSREHLRLAVAGARADGFMNGTDRTRNTDGVDYTYPETIFRDDDAVERHIRTARAKLTPQDWWPECEEGNGAYSRTLAELDRELRRAAPASTQTPSGDSPAPSTPSSPQRHPLHMTTTADDYWALLWEKLDSARRRGNDFGGIDASIRIKRTLGISGQTVTAPDGHVYEPWPEELRELERLREAGRAA